MVLRRVKDAAELRCVIGDGGFGQLSLALHSWRMLDGISGLEMWTAHNIIQKLKELGSNTIPPGGELSDHGKALIVQAVTSRALELKVENEKSHRHATLEQITLKQSAFVTLVDQLLHSLYVEDISGGLPLRLALLETQTAPFKPSPHPTKPHYPLLR